VALVHSLEGFEDYPEYGARHLSELGFGSDDLLVACTEGGETPYVIGAVEEAARRSRHSPWFLYCNPDDLLVAHVERSRRVIQSPDIRKVNLTVGPMALAGSTRMQASTVLQLAVGYALLTNLDADALAVRLTRLADAVAANSPRLLPFTERESAVYASGRFVLHAAEICPLTIFTDTTERAPTFSLSPMSNRPAGVTPSLGYVMLPAAASGAEAWKRLLGRAPRALNWPEIDVRTLPSYVQAFDFSARAQEFRERQLQGAGQEVFRIDGQGIRFTFQGAELEVPLDTSWHPLERHTLLKMLLNQHSTLVMGRLGRYESNIMTWVSPSNGKLVDRAARYARYLLADRGIDCSYEEVVFELFRQREQASANESVVMRVIESLSANV
jgi:N-acetylmuramic acid 6-phosphate etherase